MKKHLTTDALTNELTGASLFFRPPRPTPPITPTEMDGKGSVVHPEQRSASAASFTETADETTRAERPERTGASTVKRWMIRHPFEIYRDQLDALRVLAAQERLRGGTGSMSQMVRHALDQALTAAQRKEGEHQSKTEGTTGADVLT